MFNFVLANRIEASVVMTKKLLLFFSVLLSPQFVLAASTDEISALDLTYHWVGYTALLIFILAYVVIILEEQIHMLKSKPVMIAAGLIWMLIAVVYVLHGDEHTAELAFRHSLLEFAELFLFLLVAMTYINTMDERGIFGAIRAWLVSSGFSLRTIYWITGLLAFFMSPIADNLATALLLATVVITVGKDNIKFSTIACINVVVAANAGGAFSPFGDITTLMVWQKGIVEFQQFFILFFPSLVNWLIPAAIMNFAIPNAQPKALEEKITLRHGAFIIIGLFIVTILMAVLGHNYLHMPPVLGMMTGLGLLKVFGYYLTSRDKQLFEIKDLRRDAPSGELGTTNLQLVTTETRKNFDIYVSMKRVEWDTLMFFYGIILCVGGLGLIGYLAVVSQFMYGDLGATNANILVGLLSAIIDNIPVMFAVLSMNPDMSLGQWLLVTLTAGVGGSLLSFGSAAGVAVMGQARGIYTFFAHLKWSWAIMLGYIASIWVHFLINAATFNVPV
jgi:Na+/H+ antiporter NhaD/arsenite permease-like protein